MFVISKTIDTIDDLWLKRKQGLEMGDPAPEFPLHFHIFLRHFFRCFLESHFFVSQVH